jgi:hypothetical protein
MILDSQYGVCFRACLALIKIVLRKGTNHRLHVVLEHGHHNVEDCRRIFRDVDRNLRRREVDLLGVVTVAKKREKPPLMLADFLAGSYSMMVTSGTESYEKNAPEPPKGNKRAGTFMQRHSVKNLCIVNSKNFNWLGQSANPLGPVTTSRS